MAEEEDLRNTFCIYEDGIWRQNTSASMRMEFGDYMIRKTHS
jgi:hypothetical protein